MRLPEANEENNINDAACNVEDSKQWCTCSLSYSCCLHRVRQNQKNIPITPHTIDLNSQESFEDDKVEAFH